MRSGWIESIESLGFVGFDRLFLRWYGTSVDIKYVIINILSEFSNFMIFNQKVLVENI